ncbi:hypothetical protein ANN_13321 [Periplaneta americana]|uniref:Uncharacterized protein n=1 Tax=Periplaneta americana TaxID=6978 RepID=A0ABQ8TJK7_PERAM|nr:hypothetical protein ANN_13321 [Periplaneta americana]
MKREGHSACRLDVSVSRKQNSCPVFRDGDDSEREIMKSVGGMRLKKTGGPRDKPSQPWYDRKDIDSAVGSKGNFSSWGGKMSPGVGEYNGTSCCNETQADDKQDTSIQTSLLSEASQRGFSSAQHGERFLCGKVRIYKTVILPVVLYDCETWTLTLREEQRLRVFENKVLRKIFGAKRDEVTGEWRKLHNTELYAFYSSPDIIRNIKSRRLRWAWHVARIGESTNAYRVLVGRPEGKRPLGRPRHRWEDNIKMDLREVGYDDKEWINLAQDRDQWRAYVRAAINLRVP